MSDPSWTPAPTLAGDPHDDDPEVMDDLITSNPIPPDPAASRESVVNHLDKRPERNTRIVSGYQILDGNSVGVSYQLLPADHKRKSLTLSVSGIGANDCVTVADEASKLAYTGQSGLAARIYTGRSIPDVGSHTGPVFVGVPVGNASPVVISWLAVTE